MNKHSSIKTQKHGALTWTSLQDPTKEELLEATKKYPFHVLHINQCLEKGQIAQTSFEEEYIFLVLHFPYFSAKEQKIATSQVSIFLGKDYLLSIHESATDSVCEIFDRYKNQEIPEATSPGRILYHIIEQSLYDTTALIQGISQELDSIEDNVFDTAKSDVFQIGQLRKKIMRLRRTLAAQNSVLSDLSGGIDKFTAEHLKRYYEKNARMSRRLWETVEEARETIEIYKDIDFTTNTERTNDILAILTIIFTLAIPATIIGTFMGMNILLPGGIQTGAWNFFGQYTTLIVIIIISVLAALLMYLWFKKKKWM